MGYTFFFEWEVALMAWLQNLVGSAGATIFSLISSLGEELILIGVIGFIYWCVDKRFAKYVAVNLSVAIVWAPMIKNVVLRRRPYFDHPEIKCLKAPTADADPFNVSAQGFSFPSIHSTIAASAYGSVAARLKKGGAWIVATLLIFLIGISRFVLGVHYPTDVLAGWALGAAVAVFVSFLQKKITNEALLYGILVLSGIPGFFFCTSEDYFTSFGTMLGMFAAFLFEKRYVRFEETKNPIRAVLRLAGGIGLFLGLNVLLKLPFSPEFLESATLGSHLVRTARYFLGCFLIVGVYPILFRYTAKIGRRKT